MKKSLFAALFSSLCLSGCTSPESDCIDRNDTALNRMFTTVLWSIKGWETSSPDENTNRKIIDGVMAQQSPFDWNNADTSLVCQALDEGGLITVGSISAADDRTLSYSVNLVALTAVIDDLTGGTAELIETNEKLGFIKIHLQDCEQLAEIRALPLVDFIDIPYDESALNETLTELYASDDSAGDAVCDVSTGIIEADTREFNPGFYDPLTATQPYDQYMMDVHWPTSVRMRNHNLHEVYDTYQYFGSGIGVAVVDNGVSPDDVDYLSQGGGSFKMEGYYRPLGSTLPEGESDGVHPLLTDLSHYVTLTDSRTHGSGMLKSVYSIAPDANLLSMRASSFNLLLDRSQLEGVARAIVAAADNPDVRIVSLSMGTVFHSYEIERAIDYLNSKDKLMFAAAGSTIYVIRNMIGITFPGNLPTTISVTGIKDTNETPFGMFILGENAHGGIENDFVIDNANASSPATSATAGMAAVLWAINPALTRERLIDIMIRSSNYYQSQGEKHPMFGWGKVDMSVAVELVRATLN